MIIAVPAYFIITSRKIPADVGLLLFVLPHFLLLLPTHFLDTVYGWFNISPAPSEVIAEFGAALRLFGQNIIFGIGIGTESYTVDGKESFVGETNLLLGLGLETGLFAIILFIAIVILRFRHISHYRRYLRGSAVGVAVHMTTLTTLCLAVFGVTAYIFADSFMFYLFWVVFGITSSTLRTAKHEYDDRQGYYGDSKSAEATMLDVELIERL